VNRAGVFAREFDRRLDGFGPGIAEIHLSGEAARAQRLGEVGVGRAVYRLQTLRSELRDLLADRRRDLGIGVA